MVRTRSSTAAENRQSELPFTRKSLKEKSDVSDNETSASDEELQILGRQAKPKTKSKDSPSSGIKSTSSRKKARKIHSAKQNGKKKITKTGTRPIQSYFTKVQSASPESDSDDSSVSSSSSSGTPHKKRKMDPNVIAFLFSGIPESVVKAQKQVEMKREENDFLSSMGFFPRVQSTLSTLELNDTHLKIPLSFIKRYNDSGIAELDEEDDMYRSLYHPVSDSGEPAAEEEQISSTRRTICCGPDTQLVLKHACKNGDNVPWLEKYKVNNIKDILCDNEELTKFKTWMKQWRSDIIDDGGTSRRIEKKRRRKDEDSDFITSEEEGEFKKKSVLLSGPPGCGKTSVVYVVAEHYGFHVVEVNFSTRRPGKEIIQRVEEAVLSQRVKNNSHCLLLFEDIDCYDHKEDEGFYAAISQLISASMRPIVMTCTSNYSCMYVDPKIERKDPLHIHLRRPNFTVLVDKILLPIVNSEFKIPEDDATVFKEKLLTIAKHCSGDIRQSINEIQYLFSVPTVTPEAIHCNTNIRGDQIDLKFLCSRTEHSTADIEEEDDLNLTKKGRSRRQLKSIMKISNILELASLMDNISTIPVNGEEKFVDIEDAETSRQTLISNYFDRNLCLGLRAYNVDAKQAQNLILSSVSESDNLVKGSDLMNEVSDYCDTIYSDGGWECAAFVRSIVKTNKMDSVGRLAKRNGRVTSYFNRIDRTFMNKMLETFGFDKELAMAEASIKDLL